MPMYPVRRKLPVAYSTAIGRIITRWAWLEWELRGVIYTLLNIGPKEGRLSVRAARASEYNTMIQDLMHVRRVSLSPHLKSGLKSAKDAISHHGDLRNALAHGIWIKRDETPLPVLQVVGGDLFRQLKYPEPLPKSKIEPRALAFELPALKAISNDIELQIKFIQAIRRDIENQL
jgi:hypothetical protein